MITVVDSGIANIGSVLSSLRRIGSDARTTRSPDEIATAEALLLPGVGTFRDGMASLQQFALVEPIQHAARNGVPILGICLGMQLLSDGSDEFGDCDGLGLVPGRVTRLTSTQANERIPNIGWCDVHPRHDATLFREVSPGTAFYFAHSYHFVCDDAGSVAAEMSFGAKAVTVAVQHGSIFGAQFHPEKSQDAGLSVLAAFAGRA